MRIERNSKRNEYNRNPPIMLSMAIKLMVVLHLHRMAMAECPRLCDCKWKNGKESAICLNANLNSVPLHLDFRTQLLDLTGNNLVTLRQDEFTKAGLINLQRIYIVSCKLKTVERYAFKNLTNLVELDLSYNFLTQIPSHTFGSIRELRDLKLSGNPIQKIPNNAFINLPRLMRLEMTGCKLFMIEPKAFFGVEKSLEFLKIDNNRLSDVGTSFWRLQSIHGLELGSNPWNCTCNLRPFREWMIKQNIPFGVLPTCHAPKRLKLKFWNKLDLEEFACLPEISSIDNKISGIEGDNVTMTCEVYAVPEPTVRWSLKNKIIANLSGPNYTSGKKLYLLQLQKNVSKLTIYGADSQDTGKYLCIAENKAGLVNVSVSLAVVKKPPSLNSNQFAVTFVIIVIIIVVILLIVSLYMCKMRTKRYGVWRSRECRRDENYEKIEMQQKVVNNRNDAGLQEEVMVTGNMRNGDYAVVPLGDTDQEADEEDESSEPFVASSSDDKRWNSPEHLLDPEDLHIPRRTIQETRDRKILASKSGTYNLYSPSTSVPVPSSTSKLLYSQPLPYNLPSRPQIDRTTPVYATTLNSELSNLEEEKAYPDLLGNSRHKKNPVQKANSEGGSVSDITQLFCTLPRKKTLAQSSRYKSADSQSPLLPDSRYNSSGGESSYNSQENSFTDNYSSNLNRNRANRVSNSYVNLMKEELTNDLSSTPLLDIAGLEKRVMSKRKTPTPNVVHHVNPYEHHANQLEHFLEEYRALHKQLTLMKETCDNLTSEAKGLKNPTGSSVNLVSPNSNHSLEDSVDFKNFEQKLTECIMSTSTSQKFKTGAYNNNS